MEGKENEVIQLINSIQLTETDESINSFKMLSEILTKQEPELLTSFFSDVISFQSDRRIEIKKLVAAFIKDVCSMNDSFYLESLQCLLFLVNDENSNVKKAVLTTLNSIVSPALAKSISQDSLDLWDHIGAICRKVSSLLASDNDTVKNSSIKLIQSLMLSLSQDFNLKEEANISLAMIKNTLDESLDSIVKYAKHQTSSSSSLLLVINLMSSLMKQRPSLIPAIVQAMLDLYENPPEFLSESQLKSIRHNLKLQLSNFLKSNPSSNFAPMIKEMVKAMEESTKKKRTIEAAEQEDTETTKKIKVEVKEEFKSIAAHEMIETIAKLPLNFVISSVLSTLFRVDETSLSMTLLKWKSSLTQKKRDPRVKREIVEPEPDIDPEFTVPVVLKSEDFKVHVAPSDPNVTISTLLAAVDRLLESYEHAEYYKRQDLWIKLILNLRKQLEFQSEVHLAVIQKIIEFSTTNYSEKRRFTATFLSSLWIDGFKSGNFDIFNTAIQQILQILAGSSETEPKYLSRFIVENPMLPVEAVASVLEVRLADENTVESFFQIAREIVDKSHTLRDFFLEKLLFLSSAEDVKLRKLAISSLTAEFITHCSCRTHIETFCISKLKDLFEGAEMNEENLSSNFSQAWEFFFALCSEKPAFFASLFPLYPKIASEPLKDLTVKSIPELVKEWIVREKIEQSIQLLNCVTLEAKSLMIPVVQGIAFYGENEMLLSAVKDNFEKGQIGLEFLLPVLKYMGKTDFLSYFPQFVSNLVTEEGKEVFRKLILISVRGQSPILSSADFLIELHRLGDSVDLKSCTSATQICFDLPSVFKKDDLAVAMQKMIDEKRIPILFMRTVIQSITLYHGLSNFVLNILGKLISRKVWTNQTLWEGFVRCCKKMQPLSVQILVQLPEQQYWKLIDRYPEFKAQVKKFIKQQPPSLRQRYARYLHPRK